VVLDAITSEEIDVLDENTGYLLDISNEDDRVKRREMLKLACRHDWLYQRSDDHQVWLKGLDGEQRIIRLWCELKPPFSIKELMCHILDHVEDLAEERQRMPPRITAQLRGEIQSWFPANETSDE